MALSPLMGLNFYERKLESRSVLLLPQKPILAEKWHQGESHHSLWTHTLFLQASIYLK